MTANTSTLSVPVGVTPAGEQLTVDLRSNSAVLVAGIAGSGKSEMLRRMRYALERQLDTDHLFHAQGIRAGADAVILAAYEEMQGRLREPSRIADGPAVLLVDDYGAMSIGRDAMDELIQAVREVALKGRASDVHLIIATQGTEGLSCELQMNMSARIVLGRLVSPISRIFSEQERELIAGAGITATDRGDGVVVGVNEQPIPFIALSRESR
ncbi:ftsk/SpoIIIE family protein, putative [Mycobacteroides abscessus subsp. massiliense]|uniref:hypothetical protein n=1 Tax=Mycobacteroides abscessus TaxID=36809 RepID=UPI0009A7B70B|nr:hypothetical protein [Mycobacteroides abscessus]SKE70609.1 ftsk/SpoIIIE family protein, putative [Mycobacteroides abscessus subsp. massiliense]SKH80600.1 ftsk/SpoIIIE family protein, putative [Mycobacteroides abscessus subsp. massiliense]SKI34251.1 ftsk/SpoIIIE family protein, putative [Mycobacteroides abscessus subsp. massiliense]SKJ36782.1 ftsk/SpoIIIE family protein, putative [Mycobacteroides abscessus subsp. massiliense]SKK23334.1 ftsk/SpoIIIE family protein, putative [Mycobacteroides a